MLYPFPVPGRLEEAVMSVDGKHARARILVVEDEPAMAAGLRDNLEYEGHAVTVAVDGLDGLKCGLSGRFDLILLDVMLPKKHGFEVLADLRKAGVATPIIMLTAKGEERDKVRGLDGGADDYITKPFSLQEFLARVRAHLRRAPAGQAPACLEFAETKVDLQRYEAQRGDETMTLSALETRLLTLLSSAPGKVFSRAEILREVWGERDGEMETNRTVDNLISRLRQKIEPDPSDPRFLVTVYGAVYRLAQE